jgi:hypothetical protein
MRTLDEVELKELEARASRGEFDGPKCDAIRWAIDERRRRALANEQWIALHARATARASEPVIRRLTHDPADGDVLVRMYPDGVLGTLTENGKSVRYCMPLHCAVGFLNWNTLNALLANLHGPYREPIRHTQPSTSVNNLGACLADMGLRLSSDVEDALAGFTSAKQAAIWLRNESDYEAQRTIRRVCMRYQIDLDNVLTTTLLERRAREKAEAKELVARDRELLELSTPPDRGAA